MYFLNCHEISLQMSEAFHQRMEALRREMTPRREDSEGNAPAEDDFQLDPALMPYTGTGFDQAPADDNSNLGGDVILPARPPSAKDAWEPAGSLPSRKRERDAFERGPVDRGNCFGCVYDLSSNSKNISRTDFKEMCMVAAKCTAQMSITVLGNELARLYKKMQEDVNSRNQFDGRTPLPDWEAADIIEHLRHHNVDPEIQTWVRLVEIQEMITLCIENLMEYNRVNNNTRINRQELQKYSELVKMWYFVARQPLEKLFAFRKGARIDVQAMSQPFATTTGRSLIDEYQKAQQAHVRVQM